MKLIQTLVTLSDADRRLVYLSALPLWLDAEILIVLHSSREQAARAQEILESLLMLTSVSENRAVIRPKARRELLEAAYYEEGLNFARANHRIAQYFLEKVEQTEVFSDKFSWARAAVYHLLAAGEPAGWEWLANLFDDAEARGLTSATQELLQPLRELRFLFTLEDRAALAVYRAQTEILTGNYRNAERLLKAVCALSESPTLLAVAHRSWGKTLIAQQRWAQALKQLDKSRSILEHSENAFSLALTLSTVGDLYQEMADFSGGIESAEPQPPRKPWAERLRAFIYIPGHLYSQLSRRIQKLPFPNVDLSYQNWAVARLILAAASAYQKAESVLPENPSPEALYEIRIGLTRMYTRIGFIRKAEESLDELESWVYVQESEYRQAYILYWRAELARYRGQNDVAISLQEEVRQIFSKYRQLGGLAAVHKHLGTMAGQAGERKKAVDHLRQSAEFYRQAGQPLFQTAVMNQVIKLAGDETAAEEDRREYLARFPKRLAGIYRLLAFLVLVLLLVLSLGLVAIALLITLVAEDAITFRVPSAFILGLVWLAWPFVAIWIFQMVYLTVGLIISFILPIGMLDRDPPLRIVIDRDGLTLAKGSVYHRSNRIDLPWKAVDGIQEVLYRIWTRPIELISYFDILSEGKRRRIPVDTIGFRDLRQDLERKLTDAVWKTSTYTLFSPSMILFTGFLVVAGSFFFQVVFDFNFVISGVLSGAFLSTFLFFPLTAFWRLTYFLSRIRWKTQKGYPPPPRHLGEALTYLGTIIWTLLNLAYLRILLATWLNL